MCIYNYTYVYIYNDILVIAIVKLFISRNTCVLAIYKHDGKYTFVWWK